MTGGALYKDDMLKELVKNIYNSDNADEILGVMYMIDAADIQGALNQK